MRTLVASESISDDPALIGEWAKSYANKDGIIKMEFEKKENVWTLTVYLKGTSKNSPFSGVVDLESG